MSLKEKILKILSKQEEFITVSEIFDKYIELFPDAYQIKFDSYKGKKTEKQVVTQIKAEIGSTLSKVDNLVSIDRESSPNRYKIKPKLDGPNLEYGPDINDLIEKNIVIKPKIENPVIKSTKELYFVDDNYHIIKAYEYNGEIVFEKQNISSYTYVLSDFINGYKIGRTADNPEKRLRPMKTGNPNLSIHFVLPFDNMEKELHNRFKRYRNPGTEWFYPCAEIKEWVEEETNKILILKSMYDKTKEIEKLRSEVKKEFSKL